jgi:hypothetical protein
VLAHLLLAVVHVQALRRIVSKVHVYALTRIVLAHPLQTVEHVQMAKLVSMASVDAVFHQEYVHNVKQT